MDSAVTGGLSRISGGAPPSGYLSDEGDMRLTELARRAGGKVPPTECSEFSDALRSRAGVAERESRPFEDEPFRGLRGRGAPLLLATLGERWMLDLKAAEEADLGEDTGDLAGERAGEREGEDVDSESCFRERDKSESWSLSLLWLLVDCLRRGEGEWEKEAIVTAAH